MFVKSQVSGMNFRTIYSLIPVDYHII